MDMDMTRSRGTSELTVNGHSILGCSQHMNSNPDDIVSSNTVDGAAEVDGVPGISGGAGDGSVSQHRDSNPDDIAC